jgi:hypothetical protein
MTDISDDYDGLDSGPEPTEPDLEAEAYWEHCDEAHGGKSCTCPPPDLAELPEGETYDTESPF